MGADPVVMAVADVDHPLPQLRRADREAGHPVDDVHDQPVPVEVVAYDHVERSGGARGAAWATRSHLMCWFAMESMMWTKAS